MKITARYDEQSDILTYAFVDKPQPAVAEEAADKIQVRFDPKSDPQKFAHAVTDAAWALC